VFSIGLLVVFLATSSLEFPAERFLNTYVRETLINELHIPWVILDKQMVHSLGWGRSGGESKKESLKLVQPWRAIFRASWNVFGAF
jgi:hypothetical protein